MLTEEEAPNTRCCGPEGCGTKRRLAGSSGNWERYCIASKCMAWKWDDGSQWSHCDIVAKSEAEAKHGLEGTNWELKSMRREADGIRRYTFIHAGKRGDCGLKRK